VGVVLCFCIFRRERWRVRFFAALALSDFCCGGIVGFLLRWHPRFASGLLVLPLCGAALTFFAAAKKVSKESGLTPPILDACPRALNVPVFLAAACQSILVAHALAECLTHARRSLNSLHCRITHAH
jgi:hypothetical protein